ALMPGEAVGQSDAIRTTAEGAIARIAARAAAEHDHDSNDEAEQIADAIERLGRNLVDAWLQVVGEGADGGVRRYSRLEDGKGMPLLFTPLDKDAPEPRTARAKFAACTSMRDVEPSVHLWKTRQRLMTREDDDGR